MSVMGDIVARLRLDISDFNSSMQNATRQISSLGSNTQGLTSFANGLTSIGTKMTVGLTTPLVAFGAAAVKTSADFNSSMSNVRALMSASSTDLQGDMTKLTNIAKEMGATTQFSAAEAADALGYMALAGWDANQSCDALPGVLNLAAASGMGLAEASDMVTDYLSAFQQEAGQAGHMADVLAKAQATSNTSTQQLGAAFKNCAVNANSFGMDIEQTSAVLGKLADQGLKGGEAGTALNAVIRDMSSKMKDGCIQIGKTKVQITDANGNFKSMADIVRGVSDATDGMSNSEKMAAMQTTFTADSIKAMGILCNTGGDAIDEMTDSLRNSDGTAQEMADTLNDNLNGDITKMKSAFEAMQLTMAQSLEPAMRKVVQAITALFSAISKLPAPAVAVITVIGAIVAAIGPLLLMAGKLITSFQKVREAWEAFQIMRQTQVFTNLFAPITNLRGRFVSLFATMRQQGVFTTVANGLRTVGGGIRTLAVSVGGQIMTALRGLWALMLAHPFVTIAVAIAALVAAFIYLWNNCESFRAFFQNMWKAIKDAVNNSTEAIKTAFNSLVGVIQGVYNVFKTLFSGIGKLFNDLKNGDFKAFKEDFFKLGDDLGKAVSDLVENFKNLLSSGFDAMKDLVKLGLQALLDPVIDWGYSISGALGDTMVDVYAVFSDAFGLIIDYWKDFAGIIGAIIQGDWKGALDQAGQLWEDLCNNFGVLLEDAAQLIQDAMRAIVDLVNQGLDSLGDMMAEWGYSISGAMGDAMVDLYAIVSDAFNGIVDIAKNIFQLLKDIITGNWSNIGNDMLNILQSVVQTIGNVFADMANLVGDAFGLVNDAIQNGLKRIFTPIASWASGISGSLGDAFMDAYRIVSNVFDLITGAIRDALAIIGKIMQGDFSGAFESFKTMCSDIGDRVKLIFKEMGEYITDSVKAAGELIGLAIGVIAGAISNWCSNTWNTISTWGSNVVSSVGTWFSELPGKIGYALGFAVGTIASWAVNAYNTVSTGVKNIVNSVGKWFNELPGKIGYALGFALGTIASWGVNAYNYLATNIPKWINAVGKWFSELPGKIQTWLTNTYNNIVAWGTNMYNKAVETGTNFVKGIIRYIQELPGKVQNWFNTTYNNTIKWGSNMKNKATETGKNFLDSISKFIQQLPGKIQNWFTQTVNKAINFANNMMNQARKAGQNFINSISSFIQQLPGRIQSWFSQTISRASSFVSQFAQKATQAGRNFTNNIVNGVRGIPNRMLSIGRSIVQGIWNGISGMGGWLRSQISNFASGVVKGFKAGFKINSPSKIMRDIIGKGIVEGIAVGINREESSLLKQANRMADNLVDTMSTSLEPEMIAQLMTGGDLSTLKSTNTNTTDNWKELVQAVKENQGDGTININLSIDNFNNQRSQDIKGLMEEMADTIKGAKLVRDGRVIITK